MKSWKYWAPVALFFVLLSLGSKMFRSDSAPSSEEEAPVYGKQFDAPLNIQGSGFSIAEVLKSRKSSPRGLKTAGFAPANSGEQTNTPTTITKAGKPTDPGMRKKGKDKDKKKKKKKGKDKRKDAAEFTGKGAAEVSDDSEKEKSQLGDIFAETGGMGNAPVVPAGKKPGTLSLKDWEILILEKPNLKNVLKLIHYKQSGLLEDPEIFYEIVDKMLADSRTRMREYGVYALGSTPSFESFSVLVRVEKQKLPGKLGADVRAYLNNYASFDNLWGVLLHALTDGDVPTKTRAAALVKEAAVLKTNREHKNPSSQGTVDITKAFDLFIPVLEKISIESDNEELKHTANDTLTYIKSIPPTPSEPEPAHR